MPTRFFTNNFSNTRLKKFGGIFDHNPDIARFGALVGYHLMKAPSTTSLKKQIPSNIWNNPR